MTIRLLLVDDQPLLLQGFSHILNAPEDMEVIGVATDGAEAVSSARQLLPDVVLMDVRMPGTDGITATRELADAVPTAHVLVLTTFDLDEYAFAALQAGASGFLLKNARPDELLAGIRAVATGDAVIAPSTTRRLLERFAGRLTTSDERPPRTAAALSALTTREREVFGALASGLTNAEIAERLVLSDTTVKTHVARILAKLQLRDRVQAVIFAYEHDLVGQQD